MSNYLYIEGERVILETLKREDVPNLWHESISEKVWRYLPRSFKCEEDLEKMFEPSFINYERGLEHPLAVFDKKLNLYVGSTRLLNISLEQRNLEIGWTWYIPDVWESRVNTECKYLLLKYCFEELKMLRVQFKADTRNIRSDRALTRIGARKEGVLRKFGIMQDGFIRDANIYSIIDDEWNEIKNRFEARLLK